MAKSMGGSLSSLMSLTRIGYAQFFFFLFLFGDLLLFSLDSLVPNFFLCFVEKLKQRLRFFSSGCWLKIVV